MPEAQLPGMNTKKTSNYHRVCKAEIKAGTMTCKCDGERSEMTAGGVRCQLPPGQTTLTSHACSPLKGRGLSGLSSAGQAATIIQPGVAHTLAKMCSHPRSFMYLFKFGFILHRFLGCILRKNFLFTVMNGFKI